MLSELASVQPPRGTLLTEALTPAGVNANVKRAADNKTQPTNPAFLIRDCMTDAPQSHTHNYGQPQ